jgi:hypothetical protein
MTRVTEATKTAAGIMVAATTMALTEPVPGLGKKLLSGWSLMVLDDAGISKRSDFASYLDLQALQTVRLAIGGSTMMTCEAHYGGGINPVSVPRCHSFALDGAPIGEIFDGAKSAFIDFPALAPRGCGFVLAGSRSAPFDPAGETLVISAIEGEKFSESVSAGAPIPFRSLALTQGGSRLSGIQDTIFFSSPVACAP